MSQRCSASSCSVSPPGLERVEPHVHSVRHGGFWCRRVDAEHRRLGSRDRSLGIDLPSETVTLSRTDRRRVRRGPRLGSRAHPPPTPPPTTGRFLPRRRSASRGHGYGHGHGLSQYGAKGAASQGVGWRGRSSPSTTPARSWAGPPAARSRVLITADTSKDVHGRPARAGPAAPAAGRRGRSFSCSRRSGPEATRWRVVPKRQPDPRCSSKGPRAGVAEVDGVQRRRGAKSAGQPADHAAAAGGAPTAPVPRGTAIGRPRNTVNVLPLDRYVKGVVPDEVPTSWPADAVPRAVRRRAYLRRLRAGPHQTGSYDICDTTSCQVYGGFASRGGRLQCGPSRPRRGRVVTWEGEPAFTQFSLSNGAGA